MVSFSTQRSLLGHLSHSFKLVPFSVTDFLKYVLQEVSNYQCRLVTKLARAKQNSVSKSWALLGLSDHGHVTSVQLLCHQAVLHTQDRP